MAHSPDEQAVSNSDLAYQRGRADSYYGRRPKPNYWKRGTLCTRVEKEDMTPEEIQAYNRGYDDNDRDGDHKDWGDDRE